MITLPLKIDLKDNNKEFEKVNLKYLYAVAIVYIAHSSEILPLCDIEVVDILKKLYGIELERHAVARNRSRLAKLGYNFERGKDSNKGYYLKSIDGVSDKEQKQMKKDIIAGNAK